MKRFLIAVLLVICVTGVANAQRKTTVSGVVADAATRETLTGVLVTIAPAEDSTAVNHLVTGAGGTFSTGLTAGGHDITASILGYETLRRRVEVTGARQALDTMYLQQGIAIDAIVKEAVALRTSMSGDTLIYNADSYKVASDASISTLLEKMPGIKVENGTVEAQGETVKKVLIDGKEFFGEDVNAAITALPAEVVKNVEVFDKLSDNAEFTGIDDGEGYKAINITTRESMRQGIMGQVSALYGAEPPENSSEKWHHYGLVSGNVSIFQGDAKITVGGTLNNLNERHFTTDDILGMGDEEDGIAKVGRFQMNYIDMWGKKDQWNVNGTYSYNITDETSDRTVDREYFQADDALYRNYYSSTLRNIFNDNHSFRGMIDFKPNKIHELRIRPYVRYQGNNADRTGNEIYYPADTTLDNVDLNNWSNNNNSALSTGLSANYRVRLGKPGRTLSLFLNGGYSHSDRTGESYSERQEKNEDGTTVYVRQRTPSYNFGYDLMGGLTYTEPVSKTSLVNLDYSISYRYSDNDKKSYLWDQVHGDYYPTTSEELSGVYNSGYLTHRVGPGYRMQKDKTMFSAGVFYQYSTLDGSRELPVTANPDTHADFSNVTYAVMLNSTFANKSSLRLFLNSMTRNPGVNDLQDVVNLSNVQDISKGNPGLRPSYSNMLYARFILPNVEKGRTLSFDLGGNYAMNSIARRTIRESPGYRVTDSEGEVVTTLDAVGSYSEPVNIDGEWSANFGISYGFPIKFLKSNLNLSARVRYNDSPSELGKWTEKGGTVWTHNNSRVLKPGGSLTLGSNISEKVDFRISYRVTYNNVHNTAYSSSNSSYIEHMASANLKFVLPLNFTVSANMSYYNYNALTGRAFNNQYFIANAGIGKKVFRSQRGEVSLFVNDIFNQNTSFNRNTAALYIQNVTSSVIGRYFGVKFTWNIRHFGKNGSQDINKYDMGGDGHSHGPGGPGGGRPPGPPPGGS